MEALISEGRIRGRIDHYEYEVYNVVQYAVPGSYPHVRWSSLS
jgi:hypothetical protein